MENSNNANGLQFFNATGVRQPKAINDNVVIAESTRSSFKIMPAVCAILGIQDGDHVTLQHTKDENGVVTGVYIGKGKNAVYEKDENGAFVLDDRKRKIAVKGKEGFGALGSEVTPGSNVIKISVASSWDVLGDPDKKKYYSLSESPVTVDLPIGDSEFLTTELYKLEFVKEEAKAERISKKEDTGATADTQVSNTTSDVEDAGNAGNVEAQQEVTQYVQADSPVEDNFGSSVDDNGEF